VSERLKIRHSGHTASIATRPKRLQSRRTHQLQLPAQRFSAACSVKGMTGAQVGDAMASKKVLLAGNRWPEWPEYIRVTVGTFEEMGKFNAALSQVIKEGPIQSTRAKA
jgi:histidinol-phosphate/aromatic aminotransferase/cobyric acid decarboxylase-like protein